ncbi:MAG: hypothetical protein KDB00_27430 [Planctomycetales bacterium]|nr:hypothetical protein [Planctomycetales bacterium]
MDVVSRRMRLRAKLVGAALILISPIAFFGLAKRVIADEPRMALTDPVDASNPGENFGDGRGAADNADTFGSGQSGDTAPYIVFVADTAAFARCGPGENHYRTEALRRGQELEVYVETADGWLGIRPPEDSFCWMPADAVQISGDEKTGTIVDDKTVAWIGTQLGQAKRYRWQVQLDAGEQVSIIGKTQHNGESGTKTWLRIVPPSGEFRWIHRNQVADSAEQLAQLVARDASNAKRSGDIATVALENESTESEAIPALVPIRPATGQDTEANAKSIDSASRSLTQDSLREATEIPQLRAAPKMSNSSRQDRRSETSGSKTKIADRAFQVHRGVVVEDFEDRGAVIGSGLRDEWQDESEVRGEVENLAVDEADSVLRDDRLTETPTSGAAAAAAAIAAPLRRVTDVVANFISPPRLVEIDPSGTNIFRGTTASDRRWMVGSDRSIDRPIDARPDLSPPRSLANSEQPSLTSSDGGTSLGRPVPMPTKPNRIVSVAAISRVEDAIADANVDTVRQVLSKLMAEGASADEMGPVVRRAEELLSAGDVNDATRKRELLDLAQRYRNVAARRDGVTLIQSNALATAQPMARPMGVQPDLVPLTNASVQAVQQVGAEMPLRNSPQSSMASQMIQTPLAPEVGSATGYLVQVYSSRANSPPFALTDDSGLTIAYVTPYPGVNLRNHLNSRIAVRGTEKLLEGMSTPHILVDQAIRR